MNQATKLIFAAAALLSTACGMRTAPTSYSIDSDFTAEEADEIRVAVALWAVETGHNPEERTFGGEATFEALSDAQWAGKGLPGCYTLPDGRRACVGARNERGDDTISVRVDHTREGALSRLRLIVGHEWGHFCAEHTKTEGTIMHATTGPQAEDRIAGAHPHVDMISVMAWRDGCI